MCIRDRDWFGSWRERCAETMDSQSAAAVARLWAEAGRLSTGWNMWLGVYQRAALDAAASIQVQILIARMMMGLRAWKAAASQRSGAAVAGLVRAVRLWRQRTLLQSVASSVQGATLHLVGAKCCRVRARWLMRDSVGCTHVLGLAFWGRRKLQASMRRWSACLLSRARCRHANWLAVQWWEACSLTRAMRACAVISRQSWRVQGRNFQSKHLRLD
eukprot:TRINITY_DN7848_c0_g1_i1.p1 TRINITY_DN7848_c0_g1~~TRINITY_DN7848_c0_g1_i1.p1  ORF type:complete len:216 (+),score=23.16 TRINITY_DN7848_c0_g1_i1:126-773(+)